MKKMLLTFNPVSGTGEFTSHLFPVIDRFTREGFEVTVYPTRKKHDAFEMITSRGRDFEYIVCSGGDGTLSEVVNAVMRLPHKPTIGYIPCGTTNDFAYTCGLPGDITLASRVVVEGVPKPIDIGFFNGVHFSYVAAFGLFTDVSYGTPQDLKNLLGHAAYMLEGVKRLANIESYNLSVRCGSENFTGVFNFCMITNSVSVGGFRIPIESEARDRDGGFKLILLKKIRRFSQLQEVVASLLGKGKLCDSFIVRPAVDINISGDTAIDWTLDGEYGGSHKNADIIINRSAVNIMVPRNNEVMTAENMLG